jgi:hypothetical protein
VRLDLRARKVARKRLHCFLLRRRLEVHGRTICVASRATAGACHRDGSVTNASRTAWLRGDIGDSDVTVPGTGHVRLRGGKLAAHFA